MYLDVSKPDEIYIRNPQIRSVIPIKRFYEEYGEQWADRVLYAIYLVHDPLSPYRRTIVNPDIKELRKNIKKEFFSEEEDWANFNWFNFRNLEKAYNEQRPKELQELEKLWVKLTQCQVYVDNIIPGEDMSIKDLRAEISAMKELWSDYLTIKKASQESSSSGGVGYGGQHKNIFGA